MKRYLKALFCQWRYDVDATSTSFLRHERGIDAV